MTSATSDTLRAAALDKHAKTRADDEVLLDAIARHERGETWRAIAASHGMKKDALRGMIGRLWADYAASEVA